MERKKISILGAGTGEENSLTKEASEAIKKAKVLFGAKRLLRPYEESGKRIEADLSTAKMVTALCEMPEMTAAVLMSGDTGCYSGTRALLAALTEEAVKDKFTVTVLPGISAISAVSARTGISWEDAEIISYHGRKQALLPALARADKVFVLAGTDANEALLDAVTLGFGESRAFACERMGEAEERILTGTVEELSKGTVDPLTTFLILPEGRRRRLFGIFDREFCTGSAPMTKSEVRSVILSRLALRKNEICWDVGAGTGSVSIEMALAAPRGAIFSVERKEEAYRLLQENCARFCCRNIVPILGEAPEILSDLPAPEAVFLGGTGGNLEAVLSAILEKNPAAHLVMTAITLETLEAARSAFRKFELPEPEIVQVAASRVEVRGSYHMLRAMDPVFVLSTGGAR